MTGEDKKKAAVSLIASRPEDGLDESCLLVVWNKHYGGWTLPGGMVEEGETVAQACARELYEETGLHCDANPRFLYDAPVELVIDRHRGSHVYVFAPRVDGWPREMERGCPVSWFTRSEFLLWCPFREFYKTMWIALELRGGP